MLRSFIKNFIKAEQFPYHSALGWEYDSGDYHTAMKKAMDTIGYKELREEQAKKREAFLKGEARNHGCRHFLLHGNRWRRPCKELRYSRYCNV